MCGAASVRAEEFNSAFAPPAMGVQNMSERKELVGAQIVPKLGATVAADLSFVDEDGHDVTLGSLFRGRPVLLTLGYYECPMLCSLVLNAALDGVVQSAMKPGEDFDIVSVSFNPKDTPAIASKKRDLYLKTMTDRIGAPLPVATWRFLTSKPGPTGSPADEAPQARLLAETLGFGYSYDAKTDNYAHAAGLFFLTKDRVLSRTLWGLTFSGRDVKLAAIEAGEGKVGSVGEQLLLTCFMFGADGKYSVYVWGIMRLAALFTVACVGGLLFVFWRRDKKRDANVSELP